MGACEHKIPFARAHDDGLRHAMLCTRHCRCPDGASCRRAAKRHFRAEQQAPNVEQGASNVADAATDPRPFQDLDAADILNMNQRWAGDYDGLAERRFLRVLVPYSRTLYYLDGP